MTNNELLKADLLDILFEHRNKDYGAYALRKTYSLRLTKAMLTVLLLIGISVILLSRQNNKEDGPDKINGTELFVSSYELPKEKQKDPEPERQKPQKKDDLKQVKSVNDIRIVSDNEKTDVAEQEEIAISLIGDEKKDGAIPDNPNTIQRPGSDGNGNEDTPRPEPEKEVAGPTFLPSFPGGVQGLVNFLRRNLRTPDDLEAGQKITVLIKFMVGNDGSISDWKIVQSGGKLLDLEVIRVVKKMPAWNPGKQNGRPVSMYFTQPVTFIGLEE